MSGKVRQMPHLEVHQHHWVSGGKRGDFNHAHQGGDVPHSHPNTGPAHFIGRWPRDTRKFVTRPTGEQLECTPEQNTFTVVFVDEYTDGHASAGISRERWESERAAFLDIAAGNGDNYIEVTADRRMVDEFGMTPIYILDKPGD